MYYSKSFTRWIKFSFLSRVLLSHFRCTNCHGWQFFGFTRKTDQITKYNSEIARTDGLLFVHCQISCLLHSASNITLYSLSLSPSQKKSSLYFVFEGEKSWYRKNKRCIPFPSGSNAWHLQRITVPKWTQNINQFNNETSIHVNKGFCSQHFHQSQ